MLDIYEHARAGFSDNKIAELISVSETTFDRWKSAKPEVKEALRKGRLLAANTLGDYIYDKLSPELQAIWDKIEVCEGMPNGAERAEIILSSAGKVARQRLFLYAWTNNHFNPSTACKKVGISKKTLDTWIATDPEFAELFNELEWHKKNYYESALKERIHEGSETCTIFAVKTLLKDRGYVEKLEINNSTTVTNINSYQIKIEDLDLPADVMRVILEAMRKKKQEQNLALPAPSSQITQAPDFTLPKTITDAEIVEQPKVEGGKNN